MNGIQRRRYEMLLRVRDFGNSHGDLFSGSTAARDLFAAVGTTIDELSDAARRKLAASQSARADRKKTARQSLIEVLQRATQLLRVLRAQGHAAPPFEVPVSRSDQSLITAGQQLAVDAAAYAADFTSHALSPESIAATTAAFETAVGGRGTSRADYTAACARIGELLVNGVRHVRRLDVIVETALAHDAAALAVWREGSRVHSRRGPSAPVPAQPVDAGQVAETTTTPVVDPHKAA